MTWRFWFVVAVFAQCAALYWPSTPSVGSGLPLDKLVHITLFAVVAALGQLARVPFAWLGIGLLLQAVGSELVQGTMANRSADGWDLAADLVGIAIGLALGWQLRQRSGPRVTGSGTDQPAPQPGRHP